MQRRIFMKKLQVISIISLVIVALFAWSCQKDEGGSASSSGSGSSSSGSSTTTTTKPVEQKVTTITYAYAGGDPLVKELISNSVEAFCKENPDIEIIQMPSGSGAYADFIRTKDAVGEFPDMLESRDTPVYVRADKLAELPEEVVALMDNPPVYEGKHYIAPVSVMPPLGGVYYNKTIFNELGLEEPATYGEFLEICEVLKANGHNPLVVGAKDAWHMGFWWSYFWNQYVFPHNQDWIADKYRGEVSFTDPEVQTALNEYADLFRNGNVEKGFISTSDNQIASFLVTGKAAMFYSGPWMIQQIIDADSSFDFDWAPIPDRDGSLNITFGPMLQGLALSQEAAADPDKVEAFSRYVKFFFEPNRYAEYLSKVNMIPATTADVPVTYESETFNKMADTALSADFSDLMWNSKWGENELLNPFRNYAYKAFLDMLVTGGSVQELCEDLDRQWEIETMDFNPTK